MRSSAADCARDKPSHFHDSGFQPEIQGMRALAVLAVVCAHAGVPGLAGGFIGVDVFFVISGLLITRLLLAEIARTGRIDLLAFWARRARRLLPNAYAALLGTVLLALFLFPGYDPELLSTEIAHSALEVVNYYFAGKAVDYFQSEGPASPVLHFWSLAVEEQFYAIWPVLLFAVLRFFRHSVIRSAAILLGLIWCASFAQSVVLTASQQPLAYFHTQTRCWQLATGALLAVQWTSIEALAGRVRVIVACAGAAAILAGVTFIPDGRGYPGFWALLPTLGTAGLLAGFGAAFPQSTLRRVLCGPVMQWLGARSYSWYLWHWPLLALPRMAFPDSHWVALIAVPGSLAVACLAYRWIEMPVRNAPGFAVAPLPTLTGAFAGLGLIVASGHLYGALLPVVDQTLAARVAALAKAADDVSSVQKKCLVQQGAAQPADCTFGDANGQRQVVLFGDSHAAHWFDPVDISARQMGWRLVVHTKASCPSVYGRFYSRGRSFDDCHEWRDSVMAMMTEKRPAAVILSNRTIYGQAMYDPLTGNRFTPDEGNPAWQHGFRTVINRLLDAGIEVMILRDVPRAAKDYRDCMIGGGVCASPRSVALADAMLDVEVAREFGDRVTLVDFTDQFCDDQKCYSSRDGIVFYSDPHHLAASYAATLAPIMARHMERMAERVAAKRGETIATGDVPATASIDKDVKAFGVSR
jgi:peptidoglycan/LPS O-acetylase OafA/YrhL